MDGIQVNYTMSSAGGFFLCSHADGYELLSYHLPACPPVPPAHLHPSGVHSSLLPRWGLWETEGRGHLIAFF
jgi:hypothetical protein